MKLLASSILIIGILFGCASMDQVMIHPDTKDKAVCKMKAEDLTADLWNPDPQMEQCIVSYQKKGYLTLQDYEKRGGR